MKFYSPKRLEVFKNLHKGEQGIIIAGGPSLSQTDFTKYDLDKTIFLSVSLTYKANIPRMDYHFIGDMSITKQFANEISKIQSFWLVVSEGIYKSNLVKHPNMVFFRGHAKPGFYGNDITKRIYGGGTSTFLAMQFAFYFGLEPVYVVGLDHYWSYDAAKSTGEFQGGMERFETVGKDINHFTSDYYPDGVRWFDPNIPKIEKSYLMAREAYENDGRHLINSSVETKLSEDILPRR